MKRFACAAVVALAMVLDPGPSLHAQQDPFTLGPVVNVSFVRTEPGQFDDYMRYIFGTYADLMNAYEQEGLILDWSVATTQPRNLDEANVILTTTYPNMGTFDTFNERTRPIVERVMGSRTQAEQAAAERQEMRKVLGSQLLRILEPRQ